MKSENISQSDWWLYFLWINALISWERRVLVLLSSDSTSQDDQLEYWWHCLSQQQTLEVRVLSTQAVATDVSQVLMHPFSHINLLLGNTPQPEIFFSTPCYILALLKEYSKKQSPFIHQELQTLGGSQTQIIIYLIIILFFEGQTPAQYLKISRVIFILFQWVLSELMKYVLESGALCLSFS